MAKKMKAFQRDVSAQWGADIGEKAQALVDGKLNPASIESCGRWLRQCYNEPNRREQIMEALNGLIDGYGVEALGEPSGQAPFNPPFTYINRGDTYNATIVYEYALDRYFVSTWGDVVEKYKL